MADLLKPDLCVIGAGSGGLSVAAGAAQLGASVVLIERARMGGDCLNVGCVPSKALIAAARRAHQMRTPKDFGVLPTSPVVSMRGVHQHIQSVIAAIAPNDSVERFSALGVRVLLASARFLDRETIEAGDVQVKARRFVVATGSAPAIPAIPGLDRVPFFTNETLFDNQERLDHLIVVGGGPIGLELGQAYLRLGSRVTVVEAVKALSREDPELAERVLARLREEGLPILEGVSVDRVDAREGGGVRVSVMRDGRRDTIEGSHLLIATGRTPVVDGLNLDAAGIRFDRRGIIVSRALKTSNRRVYAIGDVTGQSQFTHVAGYHAGIVVRRSVLKLPARVDPDILPRVTFTEPEIAHVGLSEDEARKRYGRRIRVLRWPYSENDRAQTERETDGFIKVMTTPEGRILGASIAGAHAGEIINQWSLAVSARLNIKAMASYVSPYPTYSEIGRRAAIQFFLLKLTNPLLRSLVGVLRKLG